MRRIWDWMKICTTNRLPDGRWLPKKGQYLITPAYGPLPRKVKRVSPWRDLIVLHPLKGEGNYTYVSLEWGDWEWEPYPIVLFRKLEEKLREWVDSNPIKVAVDPGDALREMRRIRDVAIDSGLPFSDEANRAALVAEAQLALTIKKPDATVSIDVSS